MISSEEKKRIIEKREKIIKALKEAGEVGLYARQIKKKAGLEVHASRVSQVVSNLKNVRTEERSNAKKFVYSGKCDSE